MSKRAHASPARTATTAPRAARDPHISQVRSLAEAVLAIHSHFLAIARAEGGFGPISGGWEAEYTGTHDNSDSNSHETLSAAEQASRRLQQEQQQQAMARTRASRKEGLMHI